MQNKIVWIISCVCKLEKEESRIRKIFDFNRLRKMEKEFQEIKREIEKIDAEIKSKNYL